MAPPTGDDVVLLAMMTRGEVIIPDNERQYKYECTKGHNVMLHDSKPLMFLLCHDEGDVMEGLKFAQKHDLPVSVRSGAHGVSGDNCKDGSFVIDLARLNEVVYDNVTHELSYGPGAMLGDLTVSALRVGRMVTTGIAPPTGAGGLTLHGGLGWLTFKYGCAVDNITKLRILTANDGKVHEVGLDSTAPEDKELFYATRGAAASMGIVTKIWIRTYPSELITGGMWAMADDASYTATKKLIHKALAVVKEQEESGDRTFVGAIYLAAFPPLPDIPEEKHGQPCSLIYAGAFGGDEKAKALMDEFCDRPIDFGKPPAPMPFGVFHQILAGMFLNWPPFAPYWKGSMLKEIPPTDKVDEFCDLWAKEYKPYMAASLVGVELSGGRDGRAHAEKINEGNEHCVTKMRNFLVNMVSLMYTPPDPAMVEEAKNLARKLQKSFADQQDNNYFYVNLNSEQVNQQETRTFVKESFDSAERIKKVKERVDPNSIFSHKFITV